MATGERIHFFRCRKGLTQKALGQAIGFPEKSADVRIAQYETGLRTPKADITKRLAQVLDVSPEALNVPDIDNYTGLMHTLFALEDLYGLHIDEIEGEICLRLDCFQSAYTQMWKMLYAWNEQYQKKVSGEISEEDYSAWRYHYPDADTSQTRARVMPQEISDLLIKAMNKDQK